MLSGGIRSLAVLLDLLTTTDDQILTHHVQLSAEDYSNQADLARCQQIIDYSFNYRTLSLSQSKISCPRFQTKDRADRRGDTDPAIWLGSESQSERGPVPFHRLFLDGVYTTPPWGKSRFYRTNAPTQQELSELVHRISYRVAGYLEREGFLERDEENSYLNLEEDAEDPMRQVLGCSVSYRIAIGPHQGRKVFTLQTIPVWEDDDRFAQVV